MEYKNGLEDYFVIRSQKKMRYGYTTGSCAAAACKGAAEILLGRKKISAVKLMTPKGIPLTLQLQDIQIGEEMVSCAVQKDAGDDPDTTNGLLIYASVKKNGWASNYGGGRRRRRPCDQARACPEGGGGCHQSRAKRDDPKGSPGSLWQIRV